jgi:hypothetical protein
MRYGIGFALVSLGFGAVFAGAGTSDLEVALGENVRVATGVPLAVLGLVVLAAGAWLLAPGSEELRRPMWTAPEEEEEEDSSERPREKSRRRAS